MSSAAVSGIRLFLHIRRVIAGRGKTQGGFAYPQICRDAEQPEKYGAPKQTFFTFVRGTMGIYSENYGLRSRRFCSSLGRWNDYCTWEGP